MQPLTLHSPAKLNLFLHITGRRSDGYHTLQTVFQLIDLCDTMTFEVTPASTEIILTNNIADVATEDNLIWQAASLLQQKSGIRLGTKITIDKQIPMGGGLGGGSSNAATTLLALNYLWSTRLPITDLATMGIQLGADVPVFIHGNTAFAEGIGERLTPINLPESHYVIIHPQCHVSTAKIFCDQELTRDTSAIKIPAFLEGGNKNLFKNDCEFVVRKHYPLIDNTLIWLEKNIPNYESSVKMTGTGACIFIQCPDRESAIEINDKLPANWKRFLCKGLNRSPVHKELGITNENQYFSSK